MAMSAPTSKSAEERAFVLDSGASMHRLSKKIWSSEELETLRRSRTSTLVVTANSEVQTNEEAQGYVHDFDLFATLRLLEDTPAVPSVGKLCDKHTWPDKGKSKCKTDNFVPHVVPGLSSNSGTGSSSTSPPQDSSSTSPSPATERSDDQAPRNWHDSPKTNTDIKRGITSEHRETDCDTFLNV